MGSIFFNNNSSEFSKETKFICINKGYQIIILLVLYYNCSLIIKNKTLLNTNQTLLKTNNSIKKNTKNETYFTNNSSKHYNSSLFPYFSIILNYNTINDDLNNLISNILNQTFKDIEIFILFNSSSIDIKKLISNFSFEKKIIEIYLFDKMTLINKLFNITNKIKGKYLILLEDSYRFKKNEFYNIYNITKGKINNIFNYSTSFNNYFYIIKTKNLRDIYDSGIEINSLYELINYISHYPLPQLNYIPISFCPNNRYATLTYTSMISILSTKAFYTYIQFYIVIPKDFKNENIFLIDSLYEQYEYFNITFIKMDDRYNKAFTIRYLTNHAYYRYSLGELLPNLDKIIYFDADTICFTDLSNFYSLNFGGKVILGRLIQFYNENQKDKFSINTGILLLNLKEMRKMKFEKKILNILNNGFGISKIHTQNELNAGINILTADQALINIYFYNYIGIFPPKYNAVNFDYNLLKNFNKNSKYLYEIEFLYFSYKFPTIKHFSGYKNTITSNEDWIYFAKKSKYFNKITNDYFNIYNYSFINSY